MLFVHSDNEEVKYLQPRYIHLLRRWNHRILSVIRPNKYYTKNSHQLVAIYRLIRLWDQDFYDCACVRESATTPSSRVDSRDLARPNTITSHKQHPKRFKDTAISEVCVWKHNIYHEILFCIAYSRFSWLRTFRWIIGHYSYILIWLPLWTFRVVSTHLSV